MSLSSVCEPGVEALTGVDAEIEDPLGQEIVTFRGLPPGTPIVDVLGMSSASMSLAPDVEWSMRDRVTSRLLRKDQTLAEVARKSLAKLAVQPDARLG